MGFKKVGVDFLTSLILVIRNFFLLVIYPYRTMRRIAQERDYYQPLILFTLVFIYFKFAYFLRDKPYPATFTFLVFGLNFSLMTLCFYFLSKSLGGRTEINSLVFTFAYTLLPTLIWFATTSWLYVFIPPPRSVSLMGKSFSIFFTTFSLSLLIFKVILLYLAVRFSTRHNFYRITYMLILFLVWFVPYSLFLYQLKIFRVPFI